MHGQGNRKVERVEGSLVLDDGIVAFNCVIREVDVICGRCDQVQRLTSDGL